MKKNQGESGQILLIIIMTVATALTVILSTSLTSTTSTQTTKLEQDAQRALAAAEAGIESALRQGSTATIGQGNLSNITNVTGQATIQQTYNQTDFVSPLVQKDDQYNFYLSDYPTLANPYTGGSIEIYYGINSGDCSEITLEMTLIHGTSPNYSIQRYKSYSGSIAGEIGNIYGGAPSGPLQTTTFYCKTSPINLQTFTNSRVLFIRALGKETKIGVKGLSLTPTTTLKPQGKTVVSEAKTTTGVTKKVELFQSYPQIPADFFVTSL